MKTGRLTALFVDAPTAAAVTEPGRAAHRHQQPVGAKDRADRWL